MKNKNTEGANIYFVASNIWLTVFHPSGVIAAVQHFGDKLFVHIFSLIMALGIIGWSFTTI